MEGTRRGWAAGVQDTMMNVIALSGWQTLGLLDFYQLLLLLLLLLVPLLVVFLLPLLLLLLVARDQRGDFSRNSSRNYAASAARLLAR